MLLEASSRSVSWAVISPSLSHALFAMLSDFTVFLAGVEVALGAAHAINVYGEKIMVFTLLYGYQ